MYQPSLSHDVLAREPQFSFVLETPAEPTGAAIYFKSKLALDTNASDFGEEMEQGRIFGESKPTQSWKEKLAPCHGTSQTIRALVSTLPVSAATERILSYCHLSEYLVSPNSLVSHKTRI